jgi:hypothetical protein
MSLPIQCVLQNYLLVHMGMRKNTTAALAPIVAITICGRKKNSFQGRKAIAAILNRLDTRPEKSWKASRVAGSRGYHNIEPFRRQDGWVTQQQAAEQLKLADTVIKRLIREGVLPATQVVQCAPWVIDRKDLELKPCRHTCKPSSAAVECRRLCLIKDNRL